MSDKLYVTENGKRRARREHRVIVEQSIGRRLDPWEVVHHKDGNPSNNAIDNLEVVEFGAHTAEHHAGTRRGYEASRSMEAFALMREELKAERAVKAKLLAVLKESVSLYESNGTLVQSILCGKWVNDARAAIAKATGGAA